MGKLEEFSNLECYVQNNHDMPSEQHTSGPGHNLAILEIIYFHRESIRDFDNCGFGIHKFVYCILLLNKFTIIPINRG